MVRLIIVNTLEDHRVQLDRCAVVALIAIVWFQTARLGVLERPIPVSRKASVTDVRRVNNNNNTMPAASVEIKTLI